MHTITYLHNVYLSRILNASPGYVEQWEVAMRQLDKQHGKSYAVEDLCESSVVGHLKYLQAEGKAAATINRRRGYLLTLWRDAYQTDHNTHPFFKARVPKVREPKTKPVAWSIADIQAMLEQASTIQATPDKPFGGRHWQGLILLLYYTGLRINAALSLKRSDLKGKILIVPHGVQKDAEEMVFRLPQDLVNLLISLPRSESKMLIPWEPWHPKYAQKAFTKYILRPAGLPVDRRFKFHAIRRTVATLVSAHSGKEAAREAMGHSSINVTDRYLADPSIVDPTLPGHLQPQDVLPRLFAG